jgi:hypothetical protein
VLDLAVIKGIETAMLASASTKVCTLVIFNWIMLITLAIMMFVIGDDCLKTRRNQLQLV